MFSSNSSNLSHAKPNNSTQPNLDPSAIADEFDPAIVSMFQYENILDQCHSEFDKHMSCYGQYYDMLKAYQFAKETVLPFIRQQGLNAISPERLQNWLNEAHAKIANTLVLGTDTKAGEFSPMQVMRWHWGAAAQNEVDNFVGGNDQALKRITQLAMSNQVGKDLLDQIVRLLLFIRAIRLPKAIEKQCRNRPEDVRQAAIGQNKLMYAYAGRMLNREQLNTLSELVVICIPPQEYPAAMKAFTKNLVRKWKSCSVNDNKQLSELLLTAYKGVAGIHPYVNGNGRVATWLMNVILRSLDKPSILMRDKCDKDDPKSSYSIAIKMIDTDPEFFKRHVLARLNKVMTEGRVEHKTEYDLLAARLRLYEIHQEIATTFGKEIANRITIHNIIVIAPILMSKYEKSQLVSNPITLLDSAQRELVLCKEALVKLRKQVATAKPTPVKCSVSTITTAAKAYSPIEISEIKGILTEITSVNTWTAYSKGTSMMHQASNESDAKIVFEKLANIKGLTTKLGKIHGGIPVVQIANINLVKLREHDQSIKPDKKPGISQSN